MKFNQTFVGIKRKKWQNNFEIEKTEKRKFPSPTPTTPFCVQCRKEISAVKEKKEQKMERKITIIYF